MIRQIASLPKRILKRILKGASRPDPTPATRPPPPPQPEPPQWMRQEHDHSHEHSHSHGHSHDHGHANEPEESNIDVHTEETPNPNARKYVLSGAIISESFSAKSDSAPENQLAQSLIAINGVASVFGINDFVTVTKSDSAEWSDLDSALISAVKEYFSSK